MPWNETEFTIAPIISSEDAAGTVNSSQDLVDVFTVDCIKRNYVDSVSYCENQGATIASILSQEENDAILGMIQDAGNCSVYIGAELDKEGSW